MTSVLITGGAGFIGSHTALHLSRAGVDCVLLDDLRTGRRENVRTSPFIEGGVENVGLVRSILRRYAVTAVLHLAASAHAADSMKVPLEYFSNNCGATLALLEAMAAEGVKQLVFASSCAVYGNSPLAREDETPAPFSPYGESKVLAERALQWFAAAHGIDFVALRYFNVAGAVDGLGELCATSTRILPRAVHWALSGGTPLSVFGAQLATPDGTAVRDYVDVTDVALANERGLAFVGDGGSGECINIGSGRGTSVLEIIHAVGAQTGRRPDYVVQPARSADPPCVIADIDRAWHVLGWRPAHSNLNRMVQSVIRAGESQRSKPA